MLVSSMSVQFVKLSYIKEADHLKQDFFINFTQKFNSSASDSAICQDNKL